MAPSDERKHARVKDNESMNPVLAIIPTERNKCSVWMAAMHSFNGAPTSGPPPPDLIRPCMMAGAPRGGVVLDPIQRRRHHVTCFNAGGAPVYHLRATLD